MENNFLKKCSKCNELQSHTMFNKDKKGKYGVGSVCKKCCKINYQNNKDYFKTKRKEHQLNNPELYKEYRKSHQLDNPELYKEYRKTLNSKLKSEKYYENNKEKIIKNQIEYKKLKYNTDTNFKISNLLRIRFYHAIKGKKIDSILNIIGCNIEELKQYLESLFKFEMTWENHGIIWEIDHIKPCSSFDLSDKEQQKQCFNYTNLQPLFKTTKIAENFGYIDQIGNRNKHSKNIIL